MVTPSDASEGPEAKAERQRKIREAMNWLKSELAAGPLPAGVVQEHGKEAGIARRTLQEASSRLRIRPQRVYEAGKLKYWEWSLPAKKR